MRGMQVFLRLEFEFSCTHDKRIDSIVLLPLKFTVGFVEEIPVLS
jgi:hypothetical protein